MAQTDQAEESAGSETIADFQTLKAEAVEFIDAGEIEKACATLGEAAEAPDSTRYLDENIWLYRRLGDLHRVLDEEQEALDAYREAYRLDPRRREVLEPLAELGTSLDANEEAADALRALLVHHREELSEERRAWVHRTLGAHYESNDELERARHAFEKALQNAPDDQRALTGLLRVVGAVGEPNDVIDVRRKLIKSLDDQKARSMALVAMGDDWRDTFNDPWRALDTYEEALGEDYRNERALESIATVARQIGDWRRVSRAYFTLARLTDEPEQKAEWLIKSSKVAREQLWEPEKALNGFRRALELDPTRLDAFKEVTSLLVDAEDWTQLEAAYLQLIAANQERDDADERLLTVLWQKLGDLYAGHLGQRDEAITAYDRASDLSPRNAALHERVIELAEESAEHADLALEHLRELRRIDPSRLELLERIGRVFLRREEIDPAYCHFRTYDFRGGHLSQKARNFVERLESPMVRVPSR
ncbi:MAG: hypothetical protein ACOCV2_10635, partial [Persicimonas sp.]